MILTAGSVAFIMFGLLLLLIILRVPVSFTLAFAVIPILILTARVTPVMLLQRMMIQFGSFIMLSIPFFLLAATIMNEAGITDKLIRFSRSIVGFLPGGLGHINVLVSMLFAGISGSSNADAAGIGSVLIPAMEKEGYDKQFSVAVTACSAVMGNIIPPSITMVVWGGTMNTSVSGLFLAGFVPGVMIAVFQMILVLFFALKRHYPRESSFSVRELLFSFRGAILALFTPLIIVGGIVGGLVTPTEASMVAVIYSLILGTVVYRSIGWKKINQLMLHTAQLSAVVLFAVGTASIYGWVLAYFKIPQFLVGTIGGMTTYPTIMMFIFVGIFLIVGTFMDSVPAIVILGPLLAPGGGERGDTSAALRHSRRRLPRVRPGDAALRAVPADLQRDRRNKRHEIAQGGRTLPVRDAAGADTDHRFPGPHSGHPEDVHAGALPGDLREIQHEEKRMPVYRVDHIHLKAQDVEKTAQWYVEKLGGKITFEGQFKGSKVRYVDVNGFNFIVFGQLEGESGKDEPIEPTLRTRFGNDHFGFEVDDVRAAVEDLRKKGVNILEEPWSPRPKLTIAYIEAPDAARIELSQRDK